MTTHPCPQCGQPTAGAYSEGGTRWAICGDCMDRADELAQRELDEYEEREAIRAFNGEWLNDDLSI